MIVSAGHLQNIGEDPANLGSDGPSDAVDSTIVASLASALKRMEALPGYEQRPHFGILTVEGTRFPVRWGPSAHTQADMEFRSLLCRVGSATAEYIFDGRNSFVGLTAPEREWLDQRAVRCQYVSDPRRETGMRLSHVEILSAFHTHSYGEPKISEAWDVGSKTATTELTLSELLHERQNLPVFANAGTVEESMLIIIGEKQYEIRRLGNSHATIDKLIAEGLSVTPHALEVSRYAGPIDFLDNVALATMSCAPGRRVRWEYAGGQDLTEGNKLLRIRVLFDEELSGLATCREVVYDQASYEISTTFTLEELLRVVSSEARTTEATRRYSLVVQGAATTLDADSVGGSWSSRLIADMLQREESVEITYSGPVQGKLSPWKFHLELASYASEVGVELDGVRGYFNGTGSGNGRFPTMLEVWSSQIAQSDGTPKVIIRSTRDGIGVGDVFTDLSVDEVLKVFEARFASAMQSSCLGAKLDGVFCHLPYPFPDGGPRISNRVLGASLRALPDLTLELSDLSLLGDSGKFSYLGLKCDMRYLGLRAKSDWPKNAMVKLNVSYGTVQSYQIVDKDSGKEIWFSRKAAFPKVSSPPDSAMRIAVEEGRLLALDRAVREPFNIVMDGIQDLGSFEVGIQPAVSQHLLRLVLSTSLPSQTTPLLPIDELRLRLSSLRTAAGWDATSQLYSRLVPHLGVYLMNRSIQLALRKLAIEGEVTWPENVLLVGGATGDFSVAGKELGASSQWGMNAVRFTNIDWSGEMLRYAPQDDVNICQDFLKWDVDPGQYDLCECSSLHRFGSVEEQGRVIAKMAHAARMGGYILLQAQGRLFAPETEYFVKSLGLELVTPLNSRVRLPEELLSHLSEELRNKTLSALRTNSWVLLRKVAEPDLSSLQGGPLFIHNPTEGDTAAALRKAVRESHVASSDTMVVERGRKILELVQEVHSNGQVSDVGVVRFARDYLTLLFIESDFDRVGYKTNGELRDNRDALRALVDEGRSIWSTTDTAYEYFTIVDEILQLTEKR